MGWSDSSVYGSCSEGSGASKVDISRALKINGWMSPSELVWLAKQASRHRIIVEVGSWMGRSTRALADHCPGVVYAVDTWRGSDEDVHRDILNGKPSDWLLGQFQKNLADLIHSKVFPAPMDSVKAAEFSAKCNVRPDMIFIDASHDYDSVKADIQAWKPLLAPGGLLCGHDFCAPGVIRAVRELEVYYLGAGSIWYV